MAKKKQRGGKSPRRKRGDEYDEQTQKWILDTEENLKGLLSPMESHIMAIQSVLVWEKPWHSLVLLVTVNVLFWLATTMAFYPLMGLTGMLIVFVDIWCSAIWPEIRASLQGGDEVEGWTPIHPRLMSVPELCRPLSEWWVYFAQRFVWSVDMRRDSPPKFFVSAVFILIALAVFGCYVSGITLSYLFVMGLLFGPAIKYHNISGRLYDRIEPAMLQMESSLHIKRRKRKAKSKTKEDGRSPEPESESDSDAALDEFVPKPDPKAEAVLIRAGHIPRSAQAAQEEGLNPDLLSPGTHSEGPSRDISDTANWFPFSPEHDEEMSFSQGLTLPSFDDSRLDDSFSSSLSNGQENGRGKATPDNYLDIDSDHDLVPAGLGSHEDSDSEDLNSTLEQDITLTSPPESPEMEVAQASGKKQRKDQKKEGMTFISSHFKDSDSDEESLAHGLAFPDIEDALREDEQQKTALERAASAIAAQQVTKSVSGLMASTMLGLSKLKDTMMAGRSGQMPTSTETAVPPGASAPMSQSSDSEILAEFEFLEQEELDNLDPEVEDTGTDK